MEELEKCVCGKKHVTGMCSAIIGLVLVTVGHICMLKKCDK